MSVYTNIYIINCLDALILSSSVSQLIQVHSWLQDTLKRKLVDFAYNRRFFYLPGACSPFFG